MALQSNLALNSDKNPHRYTPGRVRAEEILDEIKAAPQCKKDYECIGNSIENLCKTRDIGLEGYVECFGNNALGCIPSFRNFKKKILSFSKSGFMAESSLCIVKPNRLFFCYLAGV